VRAVPAYSVQSNSGSFATVGFLCTCEFSLRSAISCYVHCLKRKSSYITLNINDSVPFFLLPEQQSDSTAAQKLECKEHSARLNVCSCCHIVTEHFAAVHTKETSVISYAVILTAWTNILVLTTTRLLLKHMYKRKVSKWRLGCTEAAKGFHAN
jgi:hypothetical protein